MYTFITFCENAAVVRDYETINKTANAVKDCAPFMRCVVVVDGNVIFERSHKSVNLDDIRVCLETAEPIRPLYVKEINAIKLTYRIHQ